MCSKKVALIYNIARMVHTRVRARRWFWKTCRVCRVWGKASCSAIYCIFSFSLSFSLFLSPFLTLSLSLSLLYPSARLDGRSLHRWPRHRSCRASPAHTKAPSINLSCISPPYSSPCAVFIEIFTFSELPIHWNLSFGRSDEKKTYYLHAVPDHTCLRIAQRTRGETKSEANVNMEGSNSDCVAKFLDYTCTWGCCWFSILQKNRFYKHHKKIKLPNNMLLLNKVLIFFLIEHSPQFTVT